MREFFLNSGIYFEENVPLKNSQPSEREVPRGTLFSPRTSAK